jgi:hypothetical protein
MIDIGDKVKIKRKYLSFVRMQFSNLNTFFDVNKIYTISYKSLYAGEKTKIVFTLLEAGPYISFHEDLIEKVSQLELFNE